ncbi:MAG: hypothetical protein QXS42_01400 [Zestosphaera sp.]
MKNVVERTISRSWTMGSPTALEEARALVWQELVSVVISLFTAAMDG